MEKILTVKNLTVTLDEHKIIDNLSFELGKDETLAVIGPNGAGKSVLLRTLLGFLPHEGDINWEKEIKIGYVPQKLSIEKDLPLTTLEFFMLKKVGKEKVLEALSNVGFDTRDKSHFQKHILNQRLGVLSGGELQRVLIAWALIESPSVLLFDEPTAGVDISSEETIYSLLHNLQHDRSISVILISHELQIIYKYATTVLCLNKEKICFGPPIEVLDKETLLRLYGKDVGYYKHDHYH